jgi:hypothetical protein
MYLIGTKEGFVAARDDAEVSHVKSFTHNVENAKIFTYESAVEQAEGKFKNNGALLLERTEPILTFTFFWTSGQREVLRGTSAADAAMRAGYGQGAIYALDFHAKGDNDEYEFKDGKWSPK